MHEGGEPLQLNMQHATSPRTWASKQISLNILCKRVWNWPPPRYKYTQCVFCAGVLEKNWFELIEGNLFACERKSEWVRENECDTGRKKKKKREKAMILRCTRRSNTGHVLLVRLRATPDNGILQCFNGGFVTYLNRHVENDQRPLAFYIGLLFFWRIGCIF